MRPRTQLTCPAVYSCRAPSSYVIFPLPHYIPPRCCTHIEDFLSQGCVGCNLWTLHTVGEPTHLHVFSVTLSLSLYLLFWSFVSFDIVLCLEDALNNLITDSLWFARIYIYTRIIIRLGINWVYQDINL